MVRWSAVHLYDASDTLLATYTPSTPGLSGYELVDSSLESAVRALAAGTYPTLAKLEFDSTGPTRAPAANAVASYNYSYTDLLPTYFAYSDGDGRPVQAGLEARWYQPAGEANVTSIPVEGIRALGLTADGRVEKVVAAGNSGGVPTLTVQSWDRGNVVAGNVVCSGTVSSGTGFMFRNRIINGDMRISQRGSSVAQTSAGDVYLIDRFKVISNLTGTLTQSHQTLTVSDIPYQYGHRYSWKLTVTSACTYGWLSPQQSIEGYNLTDLNWGTAYGSPITVSMWLRTNAASSSVLALSIRNYGIYNASYTSNIVVQSSGEWQFVTIIVPPPPANSSWNQTLNSGMIELNLPGGIQLGGSSVGGSWVAFNNIGTTTSTNIWGTTGNYIEYTGVQLEKGALMTPFEFRPYGVEMQLCQRYYQKSYLPSTAPGANCAALGVVYTGMEWYNANNTGARLAMTTRFAVQMRIAPQVIAYDTYGAANKVRAGFNEGASDFAIRGPSQNNFTLDYYGAVIELMYHWTADAEL